MEILTQQGREKQAHGMTAPGKTLLSTFDKSDSHDTRKEIAALPPEKQELFLNRAVEDKLSVRDLREQIRRSNIEEKTAELLHLRKEILTQQGREKQAHGMTAPGKTLLSIIDKSDSHNTQKEVAALPPEKQELFLTKAIDEKLSVRE